VAPQPGTEFWRDLKPIVNPLKPDAQPEVFHQFAPVEDERYYVPLSQTVGADHVDRLIR
jgi:2,4'-dihydroxyacetophenone dioxygenase